MKMKKLFWKRVSFGSALPGKMNQIGLQAEVTSFVPASTDRVELMKVTFTNLSENAL